MSASSATGPPPSGTASGEGWDERVDAIRYAVLRKLAPGLRHALMGELQAIQLSSEFAARVLGEAGALLEARGHIERMPEQCKAAVKTGKTIIEWLRPEQGTISVGEGVARCIKLAGEDWFLRGIELTTELPETDFQVAKGLLQEMVVTALLVLTDMYDRPADFHVVARQAGDQVEVFLRARAADRVASFPAISQYRKLSWADLKLLASTHGVPCVGEGDSASLQFRRAFPEQGSGL